MSSIAKSIPFGNDILSAWSRVTKDIPLSRIRSHRQYDLVVRAMEYLVDMIGDNPKHPLVGLLEILEVVIEEYDRTHHPIPPVSGVEVLRNLMIDHGLRQSDLPEIGSQGVVSEILSGKRRLNRRHATILAGKFSLPEDVFLSSGPTSIPTRDFTDEDVREMMAHQAKAQKENSDVMKWARKQAKRQTK